MKPYLIAPFNSLCKFCPSGRRCYWCIKCRCWCCSFWCYGQSLCAKSDYWTDGCKALRDYGITAPIDVHLMVKPVDRIIPDFAKAGASIITFHPETSEHVDRSLQLIKEHGCQAGLVFNPATPLHYLDHVMDKLDVILLMSVNPGFGGQSFIPATLDKLRQVRQRINESGRDIRLEVDGGGRSIISVRSRKQVLICLLLALLFWPTGLCCCYCSYASGVRLCECLI